MDRLVRHQGDRRHHLVRAALELLEHPERVRGVHRLLQHLVPDHHGRVRAEHEASGHRQRLLPRQSLHVVHRRFDRAAHLGDVRRHDPDRDSEHLEQLAPPG